MRGSEVRVLSPAPAKIRTSFGKFPNMLLIARALRSANPRRSMYRISDTFEATMKSATIPPLRVTPELRNEAESVLKEGESLSSFVEDSLRRQIEHRKLQSEFLTRGLAARESAKFSGQYASKKEVMDSLRGILDASKHKE